MRRTFTGGLIAALFILALLPATASAETVVWDDGPPKGVVGYDGIACIAEGTFGGTTYRNVTYFGADAGWMATQPQREQAWQMNQCDEKGRLQVANWFKYQRGMDIDRGAVTITVRRL